MYQLFTISGSCSTGIHILMNKLAVPKQVLTRDDVPDYTAIVPTGQVPALRNGDKVITEGGAIALYLMERYAPEHLNQLPIDEFRQWMMFNYATMQPAYGKMYAVHCAIEQGKAQPELLNEMTATTMKLWGIVNERLATREFMVGDQPTIIDYVLTVYANWGSFYHRQAMPLGEHVLRLVKHVSELAEFVAAFEQEGVSFSIPDNAF